jgi:RNA-directed DNA polymerase
VVKEYLETKIEKLFHNNSYGYRPLKSAHEALEQARINTRKYDWVIDLDIKSFFDTIDHKLIEKAMEKSIEDKWAKMYCKRWLEMPIQKQDGKLEKKEAKGTPQGGVISPLLANLFMHYAFDKWINKINPTISFERYADDVIIHCKTEEEAKETLRRIDERMTKCKLRLHPEKTKIVYCKDYKRKEVKEQVQFDFLGFSFQPRPTKSKINGKIFLGYDLAISKSSRNKIVEEIKDMKVHRWHDKEIEEIALELNPKLRGWINYYGRYRKTELLRVFRRLSDRLMKWVSNRHKRYRNKINESYEYLRKIQKEFPKLFAHWEAGYCE